MAPALTVNDDGPSPPIQIIQSEGAELTCAEPKTNEHKQYRVVTHPDVSAAVVELEQPGDLIPVQPVRQW